MSDFHLISHHLCPYVQRAVIVLTEKNIKHRRTYIDLAAKPEWFVDISPLGRVPILKTNEAVLFESQVIAEYLDEITPGSLHPTDPFDKARHRSWIEFASETLNVIGRLYSAPTKSAFEEKRNKLAHNFGRIEAEIKGRFFDGEGFQMIDGVWGTVFRYLDVFDQIKDFGLLDELEMTQNWRQTVCERSSVINATPDGYADRLEVFLKNRNSFLSTLIK